MWPTFPLLRHMPATLFFLIRGVKELSDKRADCASGLNDRTFRSERPAGADGDGCGNRLQDRYSRLNPAAIEQNRFHGLRDAMALDLGAAILRHEADDNSANHRNHNDPGTESVESHADEIRRPAMVEAQVSKQSDKFVQCEGDQSRQSSRYRLQRT